MSAFLNGVETIGTVLRMSIPYALMLALFFANVIAVPFAPGFLLKVPLLLAAFFYWSIYRPTLVPPWLMFATGMALDLLGGWPIGTNAVVFLLIRSLAVAQRRFLMGQTFGMIWIAYSVLLTGVQLLQWVVFSLLQGGWGSIGSVLAGVLLGAVLFPVVCVLLHLTHKFLPSAD